jgi:hypothetical protein
MPDDKSKVGEPDRSRVAADQDYEVAYLATKYGISREQARNLIARVGNDREKLRAGGAKAKNDLNANGLTSLFMDYQHGLSALALAPNRIRIDRPWCGNRHCGQDAA